MSEKRGNLYKLAWANPPGRFDPLSFECTPAMSPGELRKKLNIQTSNMSKRSRTAEAYAQDNLIQDTALCYVGIQSEPLTRPSKISFAFTSHVPGDTSMPTNPRLLLFLSQRVNGEGEKGVHYRSKRSMFATIDGVRTRMSYNDSLKLEKAYIANKEKVEDEELQEKMGKAAMEVEDSRVAFVAASKLLEAAFCSSSVSSETFTSILVAKANANKRVEAAQEAVLRLKQEAQTRLLERQEKEPSENVRRVLALHAPLSFEVERCLVTLGEIAESELVTALNSPSNPIKRTIVDFMVEEHDDVRSLYNAFMSTMNKFASRGNATEQDKDLVRLIKHVFIFKGRITGALSFLTKVEKPKAARKKTKKKRGPPETACMLDMRRRNEEIMEELQRQLDESGAQ